ncbi:beta-1,3-galactosyltransferase 5-like [Narcine bancroftii]|uniref:beta-1,3-galactosyltransferase 5-like n=1 Tax=Narcine bancroftii TaxID=1343680 RepID=UPI0038320707
MTVGDVLMDLYRTKNVEYWGNQWRETQGWFAEVCRWTILKKSTLKVRYAHSTATSRMYPEYSQSTMHINKTNSSSSIRWLWTINLLGTQCGNRGLKVCWFLLLILCLIPVVLWIGVWASHRFDEPHCSSRLNSMSFMVRPTSRCERNPPFLILLVTSSPDQFEARSAIRQTWGSERYVGDHRSATYFLLGHGREWQNRILREGMLYGDIIQADFQDTYYNLTLKVLMGLKWLCCSCPSASFLLKTDSDMFVNTDYLMELLSQKPRTNLYTGMVWNQLKPIRNHASKWYISLKEYPAETYPPFCSGTGYVLSTDLACRVWEVSGTVPLFKLEDVYVGMCLAKLMVEPIQIHSRTVFHVGRVPFSVCLYRRLVTSHWVRPSEQLLIWRGMQVSADEKCPGDQ